MRHALPFFSFQVLQESEYPYALPFFSFQVLQESEYPYPWRMPSHVVPESGQAFKMTSADLESKSPILGKQRDGKLDKEILISMMGTLNPQLLNRACLKEMASHARALG